MRQKKGGIYYLVSKTGSLVTKILNEVDVVLFELNWIERKHFVQSLTGPAASLPLTLVWSVDVDETKRDTTARTNSRNLLLFVLCVFHVLFIYTIVIMAYRCRCLPASDVKSFVFSYSFRLDWSVWIHLTHFQFPVFISIFDVEIFLDFPLRVLWLR